MESFKTGLENLESDMFLKKENKLTVHLLEGLGDKRKFRPLGLKLAKDGGSSPVFSNVRLHMCEMNRDQNRRQTTADEFKSKVCRESESE